MDYTHDILDISHLLDSKEDSQSEKNQNNKKNNIPNRKLVEY